MVRARLRLALAIYLASGLVAWAWCAARGESVWHATPAVSLELAHWPRALGLVAAVIVGLTTGALCVTASRAIVKHSARGRALHAELRLGLAGLTPGVVAPLAIASSLGEELFFRGALLPSLSDALGPALGITLASLAFGLAHLPTSRSLWLWTAMATVMGVVFAALYALTGELLAPVVAHAVINHENLHFLLAYDPAPRAANTEALFPKTPPRGLRKTS